MLSEYKLNSCDIAIRQPEATLEDLIDVIEGNRCVSTFLLTISCSHAWVERRVLTLLVCFRRVYVPALYVLNKIDAISIEELDLLYKIPMSCPISSTQWLNIDELIEVRRFRVSLFPPLRR